MKSLADHGIPIEANTLYPLMRRLESQGLLASEWTTAARSRANTTAPPTRACVRREVDAQWHVLCHGVGKLLETNGEDRGACRTITT